MGKIYMRDYWGRFAAWGEYTVRLSLRLSKREAEYLRTRARDVGQTVSGYVRQLLDDDRKRLIG